MNAELALRMSEKQLQQSIITLAQWHGWRTYHTHDSRRSAPGFPDLCMVHPRQGRLIFAELKSTTGRVSKHQREWLQDLEAAGQETHVWRPKDWLDGTIQDTLK